MLKNYKKKQKKEVHADGDEYVRGCGES